VNKLRSLKDIPYPTDSKFITRHEGDKVFRIRIGDFRALYKVKESDGIVFVTKIAKRRRVYHM
jgi:mRNA-degrading endonuclease RelE of RelBE toxin-antitoxin system